MRPRSFALFLALAACGGDATSPPGPPRPPAPSISIAAVASPELQGTSGAMLGAPLAVRVMEGGQPVFGAHVTWVLSAGKGTFFLSEGVPLSAPQTVTDPSGLTQVLFRPIAPGVIWVYAFVGTASVRFTITVDGLAVLQIGFGPFDHCSPLDPSVFDEADVTVPVGTLVEWTYAGWLPATCSARVVALSGPVGGGLFDSGILRPGDGFSFVPPMAGDWLYSELVNGGSAILRAR